MRKLSIVVLIMSFFTGYSQTEEYDFPEGQVSILGIFKSSGEEKELLSKNGHQILPQKGDWSLGINASSLLQYVGNAANGETFNSSPFFSVVNKSLPTATIWGKYFVADDLAWRGGLDLFARADRDRFRIDDDASTNPDDVLFDIRDIEQYGATLSLGLEKRKGKSRVQGVYGVDVFLHYTSNNTTKIQYGNQISSSNQEPTGTNFGNPAGITAPALGFRVVEANLGDRFEGGIRGFAGVEYFIAPKISLGGEFYWGVSYDIVGETSTTYEGYEGLSDSVLESSTFTKGGRTLEVGLNNTAATLNLFFYF
ncbi:MAG: hypothetical protein AAF616_04940 [Bacteroidota bacterium]